MQKHSLQLILGLGVLVAAGLLFVSMDFGSPERPIPNDLGQRKPEHVEPVENVKPAQHVESRRIYDNRLRKISNPRPILADYPNYVAPITATSRLEAPRLVDDERADLHVRAWRYSYNARAIIEMDNRLLASSTAVIVVHPWGVDDGQGFITPEPAGVVDFCTPEKNKLASGHIRQVINPLLISLRDRVGLVMYSLPGKRDPIRAKLYRSFDDRPSDEERTIGAEKLIRRLGEYDYRGKPLPETLELSDELPVKDYFKEFPGLASGPRYNNIDYWELPIPVHSAIEVNPDDIVIYDDEGYARLKEFLKRQGVQHILLAGYATDLCFRQTTAGYDNLSQDFNVFLIGDATLATFPADDSPRDATSVELRRAAVEHLITQVSWITPIEGEGKE